MLFHWFEPLPVCENTEVFAGGPFIDAGVPSETIVQGP